MLKKCLAATLLLNVLPALAQDEAKAEEKAETRQCEQQEHAQGHGDMPSKVLCAAKILFQTRIRHKPSADPVEMTPGSPPLVTDDTDTPGAGNWEINVGFSGDFGDGTRLLETPLLDVNYGVGDRLQLKYEIPYVFAHAQVEDASGATHGESVNGLSNSTFGVKYRFFDNEDKGLSVATYPQVVVRTPGAHANGEIGGFPEGTTLVLPLLVTREFEKFTLTADAGIEKSSAEPGSSTFASVAAGTRVTQRIAVMAEVAGEGLDVPDERAFRWDLGLRAKISDKQAIAASIGRDLHVANDSPHEYVAVTYQRFIGE